MLTVKNKPGKPLLVFDADCGFCLFWIEYWRRLTGETVAYEPFQEAASHFPEIPVGNFQKTVKLILPSGEVYSGAQAVFKSLAFNPAKQWLWRLYKYFPGFALASEVCYWIISRNRGLFFALTTVVNRVIIKNMNQKSFSLTVGVIFLLIASLHALRLLLGWTAVIGGWTVPGWLSWLTLIVAGYLSYQGFKLSK